MVVVCVDPEENLRIVYAALEAYVGQWTSEVSPEAGSAVLQLPTPIAATTT